MTLPSDPNSVDTGLRPMCRPYDRSAEGRSNRSEAGRRRCLVTPSRCLSADAVSARWSAETGRTARRAPTNTMVGDDDHLDPILEMWVDVRSDPAAFRVVGLLDWSTQRPLLSFVEQLLVEGVRHFTLDVAELEIGDAQGANALAVFQQRARQSGGSLVWCRAKSGQPRRSRTGAATDPR
jgi:hypothetical protein